MNRKQLLAACRQKIPKKTLPKGFYKFKKAELKTLLDSYSQTDTSISIKTNKNYSHIYHIADIHIRLDTRHQEYNEVFEKLYQNISQDNLDALLVIPGDIFHSKKTLYTETIICARDFLAKLGSLIDTVIISGNHDLVENNPDSKGFLQAFDYTNLKGIHYLQHSGLYQFGNVTLSVASLEGDKPFVPATCITQNDCHKVALWHGTLNGSKNDIGYTFNEEHYRNLQDFEGYDITCLGDIHLMQFIKPNVAYSGSLIQQNFGENTDKHGYILWNLNNKTGEFIKIENQYAFITIDVTDHNYTVPSYEWVKKVRLRIRSSHQLTDQLRDKIVKDVKNQYELIDLKIEDNTFNYESTQHEEGFTKEVNDIDLIKIEMTNRKDTRIKDILKIHDIVKTKCELTENTMNNQKWNIKELSFCNMMLYGNNHPNRIQFNYRTGISTISSDNATGKSSIVCIVLFAIFGSVHKSFVNSALLNNNADKLISRIILKLGEHDYVIERTGKIKKLKNRLALQTQSSFKKILPSGEHVDLNGIDQKDTDRKIAKLFGTRDDFILTNICSNSVNRSLIKMGDAERMKTLETIFNLDNYKILHKKCSELLKESDKKVIELGSKIKECETQITNLENSAESFDIDDQLEIKLETKATHRDIITQQIKLKQEAINQKYQQFVPGLDKDAIQCELTKIKEVVTVIVNIDDEQTIQKKLDSLLSKFHQVKISKNEIQLRLDTIGDIIKPTLTKNLLNNRKVSLKHAIDINTARLNEIKDLKVIEVTETEEALKNRLNILENRLSGRKISKDIITDRLNGRETRFNDCVKQINSLQSDLDTLLKTTIVKDEIPTVLKQLEGIEGNQFKAVPANLFNRICRFLKDSYNDDADSNIDEIRTQLSSLTVMKGKLEAEIGEMKNCSKIINKDIKTKKKIDTVVNKLQILEKQKLVSSNKDCINKLEIIERDIACWQKLDERKDLLEKLEQHKVNDEISDTIDKDRILLKEIKRHKRIAKLETQLEDIERNQLLSDKIEAIKRELGKLTDRYDNIQHELSQMNAEIAKRDAFEVVKKEIEHSGKRMIDYKNKFEKAKSRSELLALYKEITHSKCLPLKMIKIRLKYVENDINNFLKDSVKYQFHFNCDNNKVDMYATKNSHELSMIQMSGYEKTTLEIALKRALNKYSFVAKSTLMCIDECLQSVGIKNYEKLADLFLRLKKDYRNILLISHIEKINMFSDNTINIDHDGTYSKINSNQE